MKNMINELWHGNIVPQEDSRTNSKEMQELLGYMARHHEDLEKTFTDEQKEIFEKFHVVKSKTIEYRFGRVRPPKARSWQSRARVGDRQRLCILLLIIKKYIMIFEICNAFVTLYVL